MLAVDTSTFIAYLEDRAGHDVELLDRALETKQVILPPVVLTELLSDRSLPLALIELFRSLPVLEVLDGYWDRAGISRAKVLGKGHKARIADALITQSCLDHKLCLLSRDPDFKAFSRLCGLTLAS